MTDPGARHVETPGRLRRRRVALMGGLLLLLAACAPGAETDGASGPPRSAADPGELAAEETATPGDALRPANPDLWPAAEDSLPGTPWTRADWDIFAETIQAAEAGGFDELPLGEGIAAMGLHLLGTPYIPQTLEVPGPERLVVNLRALDCVTFVESVLALTRVHRRHGVDILDDPSTAREAFESALAQLRYRDGEPAGYASRLHYFSDWIREGESRGRVAHLSESLGGTPDREPVDFMSRHPDAYRQLADAAVLDEIRAVEADLARAGARWFIPEAEIDRVAGPPPGSPQGSPAIRTGDVIAATSTVAGLDVAHTGFAIWRDGVLHLLHAPLVGSTVVLSERPLAQRIREIRGQDGIMVARPLDSWFSTGS